MRAAIMTAPYEMTVGSCARPRPGPGEVLVSVAAAGICAGDMYVYLGRNPYSTYPQVCGHEIAGRVAETGPEVESVRAGDRVVVEPFIGCGACYPCRIGKRNCCAGLRIIGMHLPGGYAEYVAAPAANVHPIPDGLSLPFASFAEPVAIGIQACRRGQVSRDEEVLILGCGPIGLSLLEVARARGARVVATDVLESRLAAAAALGADTLPAAHLLDAVMERTHGEGAPVVIEATGNVKAMESAVDLVASGGRNVIVGLVKQGLEMTLPGLDLTRKEMTIVGSRASVNCFPEALDLLSNGSIRYPRVATEFSLWDAPRVFAELAENPGSVHKGVLVRDDG